MALSKCLYDRFVFFMLSNDLNQLVAKALPVDKRILGTYPASIDDKYRLLLPQNLCKQVTEDLSKDMVLVLVKDPNPYIALIPDTQWTLVENVLAQNCFNDKLTGDVLRVLAGMQKTSFIGQRLLIPQIARSALWWSRDVYCVWFFHQIRIYSSEVYQTLIQQHNL